MYPSLIAWLLLLPLLWGCEAMKQRTKQASPEMVATYVVPGTADSLRVSYSSPSKKGRVVFGELVPYGEVWRTGANEATVFRTDVALTVAGQPLPAGTYTLWTIPEEEQWTVIFNENMYPWGIKFSGQASRNPEADALQVQVPVQAVDDPVEPFQIAFGEAEGLQLTLTWDQTQVAVPLTPQP